jgi:hypothetical protein
MRGAKVTYSLQGHMTQSSTACNITCISLAALTFTGNNVNEGKLLVSIRIECTYNIHSKFDNISTWHSTEGFDVNSQIYIFCCSQKCWLLIGISPKKRFTDRNMW